MQERELEAGYFAVMQAKWRNAPQGCVPRLIFLQRQGQHDCLVVYQPFVPQTLKIQNMQPYAIIVFFLGLFWLVEIEVLLGGRLECIGGWEGERLGTRNDGRPIVV